MKRPSFQFYPGDWLNDASLRMVSVGARGLWIEMLCLMHQGSEYGFLKVNGKVIHPTNLARISGSTLPEVEGWLDELSTAGVYSKDDSDCIYSRRMLRDEGVRKSRAAGGILGGNPNLKVNGKDNHQINLRPTPSSSSSSSIKQGGDKSPVDNPRSKAAWWETPKALETKAQEEGINTYGKSSQEVRDAINAKMGSTP